VITGNLRTLLIRATTKARTLRLTLTFGLVIRSQVATYAVICVKVHLDLFISRATKNYKFHGNVYTLWS